MSLGFGPAPSGFTYGTGGTPHGGGFLRPATRAVATTRQAIATAPLSRPATSIPYYDPSRVVDLSRLKVVKDIRSAPEFAEERGEVQTGDNGITGPGSTDDTFGMPQVTPDIAPTEKPAMTPANLGLLAVAAFLLFGG